MRRYKVFFAGAVLGLLAVTSTSALAASPAFEFDVGVDDSTITVVVTFEAVPQGFAWGAFEDSGFQEQLVGALPADAVDSRGRPLAQSDPELVVLEKVETGVYEGEVRVGDGKWAIVAWPLVSDFNPDRNVGAARTVYVKVGDQSSSLWLIVAAATVLVVAAAGATWRSRSRTSRTRIEAH